MNLESSNSTHSSILQGFGMRTTSVQSCPWAVGIPRIHCIFPRTGSGGLTSEVWRQCVLIYHPPGCLTSEVWRQCVLIYHPPGYSVLQADRKAVIGDIRHPQIHVKRVLELTVWHTAWCRPGNLTQKRTIYIDGVQWNLTLRPSGNKTT